MSTIEITRIEDVQVGDLVTLEDRRTASEDGTFKPDPAWRLTGHVREVVDGLVAVNPRDGEPYGWSVRIGQTLYTVGYLSPGGEMWSYSLVSATREVPEWEPGTVGTATISTCETSGSTTLQHGIWFRRGDEPLMFMTDFGHFWVSHMVATFVPDDIEALRADLDAERAKVADLTGRNAALEALVREQKQGIQARDTWIEDQTTDA